MKRTKSEDKFIEQNIKPATSQETLELLSNMKTHKKTRLQTATCLTEVLVGLFLIVIGYIAYHHRLIAFISFGGFGFVTCFFGILLLFLSPSRSFIAKIFWIWKLASLFFGNLLIFLSPYFVEIQEKEVPEWYSLTISVILGITIEIWLIISFAFAVFIQANSKNELLRLILAQVEYRKSREKLQEIEEDPESQSQNKSSESEKEDKKKEKIVKKNTAVLKSSDPLIVALRKFNNNPKNGILYLWESGILPSGEIEPVANFMFTTKDLNPKKIGEYIGRETPFEQNVLKAFTEQFDFETTDFQEALRIYLKKFRLPGEAQQISRIVEAFAKHYCEFNKGVFPSSDLAFLLAFSIIMLNTDLHNPSVKKKMSKKDFVKNSTFPGSENVSQDFLENIYDDILKNQIKLDLNDTIMYRSENQGYLKKLTKKEKKWIKRYFILSNNCLYYFKDEKSDKLKGTIPLEGLQVKNVYNPKNSQNFNCFEIHDPSGDFIKSAKMTSGGTKRGEHEKFVFKCKEEEDKELWMKLIKQHTLVDPLFENIKQIRNSKLKEIKKEK